MADCEHLSRTSAYFDGALAAGEEEAALAHLGTCTACQLVLGDAVAIDAALSSVPAAAPSRSVTRRRWPLIAVIAGGLAAAAATLYVVWPRPQDATTVAIELPPERALEVRFTGERFGRHRPYNVLRGDHAVEPITLADLARLEQRGETRDLIAALASTGGVTRARELATALPAGAATESDRAALALASNDAEHALDLAYRAIALDPQLASAWWNLGLAARSFGLPRVARAAFERVAARAEPGWADEARAQLAALDREIDPDREFVAFDRRGQQMVAGGPVITIADVRRYPAFSRAHVLDALRVSPGARIDELRPLVDELDAQSGVTTMRAAADRAAAGAPATRARFADRYRAVAAYQASAAEITKLIEDLRAAGPDVDDLRAGAIITGSQVEVRLDELRTLVAPWHDPWFDIVVERNRIWNAWPEGDLRGEPALRAVLATCTNDAWSLRCGQAAQDLAELLFKTGRAPDAEPVAKRAIDWFRRAVAPTHLSTARALIADIHRNLGRYGLARAELEEVILAVESIHCGLRRYATISLAHLELEAGNWPGVRAALPDPTPPEGCGVGPEIQAVGTATDLARRTRDGADLERARRWIDTARASADPTSQALVTVATARVTHGQDPAATAALRAWLAKPPPSEGTPWPTAIRTWGFTTLIADTGERGAMADVLALAASEHPGADATCSVVASYDDGALTVAARTPAGVVGDHRRVDPAALATTEIVPSAIADALASCTEIAVNARPPLHGRADLLPPRLPWWFAGDAPAIERGRPPRAIEILEPRPPDTSLPRLPPPGVSAATFDASIRGRDATPTRVLAALADATYVEIHAHGIAAAADDDAAFLALSPDADGTFALRADAVRRAKLTRGPIVVLAACRAAVVAPYLAQRWSLPDALRSAGASAVVAVDVPIDDASARRVFDELHRRIDAGEPVASAVAAIRASASADAAWVRRLMVFR